MSRRKRPFHREQLPDPKYGSLEVAAFINGLLRRGKRSTAENILYGALNIIEERAKSDPLEIFIKAMKQYLSIHYIEDSVYEPVEFICSPFFFVAFERFLRSFEFDIDK